MKAGTHQNRHPLFLRQIGWLLRHKFFFSVSLRRPLTVAEENCKKED